MSQDSHTQSPISQIGDMLDDGLILTNLDGVVLSANPAAVRWFGENLTGQKIFDVINHPILVTYLPRRRMVPSGTKCAMSQPISYSANFECVCSGLAINRLRYCFWI